MATIGDSEAGICRTLENGRPCLIPLSCRRDWNHPKEIERAKIALKDPQEIESWLSQKSRKPRFPKAARGINLSRSLGDVGYAQEYQTEVVSSKAKVLCCDTLPGDVIFLACDGVVDVVPEHELLHGCLAREIEEDTFAYSLVQYAKNKGSTDNMTAIVLECY